MLRFKPSRIFIALLIIAAPALQADPAGTVEFIKGRVIAIGADNKMRPVAAEDEIGEGQVIITGREGELHMRMVDGAMIAVRPNSRLKIDHYQAEGKDDDGAFFELLKGAMRSVTGWIGQTRKDRYRIQTETATIGVRGTDHETAVIARNEAAQKLFGEPGTYDKVNDGSTIMQSQAGQVVLQPNQAGFVGFDNKAPKKLNKVPDFFKPTSNEQRFNQRKMDLRQQLNKGNLPQPMRPGAGGGPHAPAPPTPGGTQKPSAPKTAPPGMQIAPSQTKVLTPAPASGDKTPRPGAAPKKIEPPPASRPEIKQMPDNTKSLKPQGKVEPPPPSMNKHDLTTKLPSGGKADQLPARLPAVQMKTDEKTEKDESGLKLQQFQPGSTEQVRTPINKLPAVQSNPTLRKSAGELKVR